MRLFRVEVGYISKSGHQIEDVLHVITGGYDAAEAAALRWLEVQEGYEPGSSDDDKPVPEQVRQIEAIASLYGPDFDEGTLILDAAVAVH